jgi:hypothetical protein
MLIIMSKCIEHVNCSIRTKAAAEFGGVLSSRHLLRLESMFSFLGENGTHSLGVGYSNFQPFNLRYQHLPFCLHTWALMLSYFRAKLVSFSLWLVKPNFRAETSVYMSFKRMLLLFFQVQVNKSDYDNVTGALPYLKVNRKAE